MRKLRRINKEFKEYYIKFTYMGYNYIIKDNLIEIQGKEGVNLNEGWQLY